jgi:hypothetical protein
MTQARFVNISGFHGYLLLMLITADVSLNCAVSKGLQDSLKRWQYWPCLPDTITPGQDRIKMYEMYL